MKMAELARALDEMTLNIPDSDKLKLGNELKRDGGIYIQDLLNLFENNETSNLEPFIEDLKTFFANTGKRLEEVFNIDKSGDIYRSELIEGLKYINLEVPTKQITDFMSYLNPDIKNLSITTPNNQKITASSLISLIKLKPSVDDKSKAKLSHRLITQKIVSGIYQQIAE